MKAGRAPPLALRSVLGRLPTLAAHCGGDAGVVSVHAAAAVDERLNQAHRAAAARHGVRRGKVIIQHPLGLRRIARGRAPIRQRRDRGCGAGSSSNSSWSGGPPRGRAAHRARRRGQHGVAAPRQHQAEA